MKLFKYIIFSLIAVSGSSALAQASGNVYVIENIQYGTGNKWITQADKDLIGLYLSNPNPPLTNIYTKLGDPEHGALKTLRIRFKVIPAKDYFGSDKSFPNEATVILPVGENQSGGVNLANATPRTHGNVYIIENIEWGEGNTWYSETTNNGLIEKFLDNPDISHAYQYLGDPAPGEDKTFIMTLKKLDAAKYFAGNYFKKYPSYIVQANENESLNFANAQPAANF